MGKNTRTGTRGTRDEDGQATSEAVGDPAADVRRQMELASSATQILKLLEFIGSAKTRTLKEVMAFLSRPKSTVLRYIDTLVQEGLVRRVAPGEYAVTLKLWRLGCQALDYSDGDNSVSTYLKRAVEETGESALYAVYEDGHSVYIEKETSPRAVSATVAIGSRTPAYATATGKALLAYESPAELERVMAAAKRYSPSTILDADKLRRELEAVRETGIAYAHGEWREEVWGAASPVFDRSGIVVAAMGVFCPRHRGGDGNLEAHGKVIRRLARELSISRGAPG